MKLRELDGNVFEGDLKCFAIGNEVGVMTVTSTRRKSFDCALVAPQIKPYCVDFDPVSLHAFAELYSLIT